MTLANLESVAVNWSDRWSIYHRLQELQIPCHCSPNQPLRVQLDRPSAAVQLWSVVKQHVACRQELLQWLERCSQLDCQERNS
ncbi:MAG: hypothetical protein HC890_00365 [Chloroflexaceae bacterium]|nr:hypothetical protein [Chloroflexaceae bacterium]